MLLLPCGLLAAAAPAPSRNGAGAYRTSIDMAELSLLPALRQADNAALIVADGTFMPSSDQGVVRTVRPLNVARVLAMSLDNARSKPYPACRK
jgi:hypothetical protein